MTCPPCCGTLKNEGHLVLDSLTSRGRRRGFHYSMEPEGQDIAETQKVWGCTGAQTDRGVCQQPSALIAVVGRWSGQWVWGSKIFRIRAPAHLNNYPTRLVHPPRKTR